MTGSADLDSRTELAAVLAPISRLPRSVVNVDLSGVDFVTADGAAALAHATVAMGRENRHLVLHHAPPHCARWRRCFPMSAGTWR
ncbi:STAS domain-containing protein [Kitasatospora sp. CMC57]|uniref:STAS domain-containing protein n=1 Tax=Kitasatospora sp. CMC57 TaxID=3231513 RepID=UPI0038B633DC